MILLTKIQKFCQTSIMISQINIELVLCTRRKEARMPELRYQNGLPSRHQFQQDLANLMEPTNPVDDLLEVVEWLREYEQQYKLSSTDFYRQYQAGTLPDPLQHCTEWAALYNSFLKIKTRIENTLMQAAIEPKKSEVLV